MTNSRSTVDTLYSGILCEVLIPFCTSPGFAIPVIKSYDRGNARYIQRADREGKILKFDMISVAGDTLPNASCVEMEIGSQERFAIVEPSRSCIVGTKEELKGSVKTWLYDLRQPIMRLNFSAFCDDYACGRDALEQLLVEKKAEFGSHDAACRWFISSYIFSDLLKMMPDDLHGKMQYPESMSQISINIGRQRCIAFAPKGSAESDSETETKARNSYFLKLLAQVLEKSTSDFRVSLQQSTHAKDLIDREISLIKLHSRQEARIAAILSLLLADAKLGIAVLKIYHDRARFARASINLILRNLSPEEKIFDVAIAKILQSILRNSYPRQAGILLLEAAKQLYPHRRVADFIRQSVNRSNSISINAVKGDILLELDKERRPM